MIDSIYAEARGLGQMHVAMLALGSRGNVQPAVAIADELGKPWASSNHGLFKAQRRHIHTVQEHVHRTAKRSDC